MTYLIVAAAVLFIGGFLYMLIEPLIVKRNYHRISKHSRMNLRVVQLSDLHGRTRFLNGSISHIVNRMNPDYVVITGDLASRKEQWGRVIKEIGRIKCANIIFVPGNHDRYILSAGLRSGAILDAEYQELVDSLQNLGVTVLENSSIQTEVNGKPLFIYGFDNSIYGNERLNITPEQWPKQGYVILLAHSPNIIHFVRRNKLSYDLLLVGHTHGGQIRCLGWSYGGYKHFHVGLKRIDGLRYFYIHRGLGTVKLPFRLACSPEIAVFEIG